jgi:uncharacterized delta-60 repeat protein
MRGSVLLTFDEAINDLGFDGVTINVAGQERYVRFIDSSRIYTTPINTGEVCSITLSATASPQLSSRILVNRIDYTTDDVSGDNGVKETYIGENIAVSGGTSYTFTATTRPDSYGFEYKIECYTDGCFPANTGFNFEVYDSEIQPDGKIICGGVFTQYSGIVANNLCRLNVDGTLDTTFNYDQPVGTFNVGDIKLLSDGKILARISPLRLARINSDGSLDTTFNTVTFNSLVINDEEIIDVQSDGKILFGGAFDSCTSAGQTLSKAGIVRLNPNGTIDTTFNQSGTGFTTAAIVRDVCIQSDGKILLAGSSFVSYNGVTLNSPGLIRLNPDGSLDTTFTLNSSTSVTGYEVEILSDGKILFYNRSGGYNGNSLRRLVRLNSNGSLDTSFDSLALSGVTTSTPIVNDILVDNLDKTFILGDNLRYSGTSIPSLFKINYDGTRDTTFSDGSGFLNAIPISAGDPLDIELTKSGCLYAVGNFDVYYDSSFVSVNIVKIRPDGTPFLC